MAEMGEVRAAVFDAYGTLYDWASAAARSRDALGERWQAFAELWRQKQLQYTWLRSLQGRHADFWQVTGDALDFTMDAFGVPDAALRERLLGLYARIDAFPDARPVLERLRATGVRTAILSNGSPRMLAEAATHSGLAPLLEAVLSVEDVKVYKPHHSVYQLACNHLRLWPGEILFVSSNGWDAYSARAFGMRVAWCNRTGQPHERLPGAPETTVKSLEELATFFAH